VGVGMGMGVDMVGTGRRLVMMMVVRVMGSTSRIAQISQINIVIFNFKPLSVLARTSNSPVPK